MRKNVVEIWKLPPSIVDGGNDFTDGGEKITNWGTKIKYNS